MERHRRLSEGVRPSVKTRHHTQIELLEGRTLLSTVPAFPGAVGFGAGATGGRGGSTYHVTNLNDSGAGSFRDAVSRSNRIVVFDVGGDINLKSAVSVKSNLTLAGQTAPGDGIALQGREVSFSDSQNDIVRYLRFRQGANDPDTGKSTLAADSASNLIFDHVSIAFGSWDNIDMNGSTNITVQDSIIADPIGQQFNAHVDSGNVTWYRNIFAEAHNRSPLQKGNAQFINNVVYDFQAGYTAGDSSGKFLHDIVGNYFVTGPQTTNSSDAYFQMSNQSAYINGNFEDTSRDGTLNGSTLGYPGSTVHLTKPWSASTNSIPTLSASAAFTYDVANAGDSLHRDDVDSQVIGDVKSLGKSGQLWSAGSEKARFTNGGYGTPLKGGAAPLDTDQDGMPDVWENGYHLNPNSAADANGDFDQTGYTNIEKYINGLVDGTYPTIGLPGGIVFNDVGPVSLKGNAVYHSAEATYAVTGSGATPGTTGDAFGFASRVTTGDATLIAKLSSVTASTGWDAGIMFRGSDAPDAAYAFVNADSKGHLFFTWRGLDGGPVQYRTLYVKTPVWMKLTRVGGTLSGYYSTDGSNWTLIGSHGITLGAASEAGLAVSATPGTLATATFSNLLIQ